MRQTARENKPESRVSYAAQQAEDQRKFLPVNLKERRKPLNSSVGIRLQNRETNFNK